MRSHGQSKGFAFITAPQHVTKELIKLNGIQFQSNCLIVEEAKSRRKFIVDHNVVNNFSENENTFPRNKIVPGDVTYADAVKPVKKSLTGHRQNRIVIFGDTITRRRIRVRDFIRELDTGHAKIRTFPGAISNKFPHYITPTLEDSNFDIAILHFGMNDLLENRNRSKAVDELMLNLKKTATKCMPFGVSKVYRELFSMKELLTRL